MIQTKSNNLMLSLIQSVTQKIQSILIEWHFKTEVLNSITFYGIDYLMYLFIKSIWSMGSQ